MLDWFGRKYAEVSAPPAWYCVQPLPQGVYVFSVHDKHGYHSTGKPGNVREFQSGQGKVRVTLKSASSCS